MADYVAVLTRAISSTGADTPEARRALYDKARSALLKQLESREPPLSALQLAEQKAALDRAVREVEAQFAPPLTAAPSPRVAAPTVSVPNPSDVETPAVIDPARPTSTKPISAKSDAARVAATIGASTTTSKPAAPQPATSIPAEPQPAPTVNAPAAPMSDPGTASIAAVTAAGREALRSAVQQTSSLGEAASATSRGARTMLDEASAQMEADGHAVANKAETSNEDLTPAPGYGPQDGPVVVDTGSSRNWLWPLLGLILIGLVALGFWQRETLMSFLPSASDMPGTSSDRVVKNEERLTGDRGQDNAVEQPADGTPATPTPSDEQAGKPPATQSALIEENADDPGKAQVFDGSVNWSVRYDGDEPVIDGQIDIPERKISLALTMRRNTDQTLPASHVIELLFTLPSDFAGGGISNVPGLLMKATPQAQGAPLAGESVRVTNGYFWIGLSNADVELRRNLSELKTRGYIDIPVVYDNGRRAILSLAKGPDGASAFDEAFAAWQQ